MGLAHSPRTITDGIVFYFDEGNTPKSWKGAPTTNLTSNLGIVAIQGAPTVTYVGVEAGWKKYSLNGTWTAGTYPYSVGIDGVTFTGGVTYSSGVFIRTNVPAKFANLFGGMNYVNEPMNNGGTSFSIAQPDGSLYVGRAGFQYTSTTSQTGYILSQPVIGQSFSSATDFVYIKDGQVETGSFPTPFTSGTRSSAQAILDMTGRNTITANNLSYTSNGTFSFNGTSSFISIPNSNSLQVGATFTINTWINASSLAARHGVFSTRTANDAGCWQLEVGVANSGTGRIAFTGIGTWIWESSSNVIATNTWYNICLVKTNNAEQGASVYLNGVLLTPSVTTAYTILDNSSAKVAGQGTSGTQFFSGIIDSTSLYNRALTAAEVAQNFNALRGRYGI